MISTMSIVPVLLHFPHASISFQTLSLAFQTSLLLPSVGIIADTSLAELYIGYPRTAWNATCQLLLTVTDGPASIFFIEEGKLEGAFSGENVVCCLCQLARQQPNMLADMLYSILCSGQLSWLRYHLLPAYFALLRWKLRNQQTTFLTQLLGILKICQPHVTKHVMSHTFWQSVHCWCLKL